MMPFPVGAALFAGGITLLNLRGIRSTAFANQAPWSSWVLFWPPLSSWRFATLPSAMVFSGLFSIQPFYRPGTFHVRAIASATSFAALTYLGFDAVTTMAEDVTDPRRNVLLAAVSVCLFTDPVARRNPGLKSETWATHPLKMWSSQLYFRQRSRGPAAASRAEA
jgi:amino acid transporter